MKKRVVILLSRQSLRPCLMDPWVKNSIDAVKWIKENNHVICTSVGMSSWELVAALSRTHELEIELFLPLFSNEKYDEIKYYYIDQFQLSEIKTNFIPIKLQQVSKSKEKLWQQRDKQIIESADIIVPVCVRKNGNLERLYHNSETSGKTIIKSFQTNPHQSKKKLGYRIPIEIVNDDSNQICQDYIIHWTRTFNSHWPGERLIDYYMAISKFEYYPRDAYHTLLNIITNNKIFSSGKNMPDNIPTVSFSGQSLYNLTDLIRWRSRFQMSFEPYGIGIEKSFAEKIGIQKVIYISKDEKIDTNINHWLYQSRGEITDWRYEMEYRYQGDLDLTQIPGDKIVLITRNKKESEKLYAQTNIRTFPFTTE
ncbi:hypothetical protein ACFLQG_01485 [Candidatus Zixiibacteriota bacterium]